MSAATWQRWRSHLHTRLLNRSTRKLVLTPEGERYYAEVRRILDAVGESEMSLHDNVQPSGLLRVACPTALSHQYVMPLVPEFLRRFPGLQLDLQINDRFVNLLDEGAELAIRIGHLENSALRARRIGSFKRVCVASKDYLAERGIPTVPDDLRQHDCVLYTLLASGASWRFKEGGRAGFRQDPGQFARSRARGGERGPGHRAGAGMVIRTRAQRRTSADRLQCVLWPCGAHAHHVCRQPPGGQAGDCVYGFYCRGICEDSATQRPLLVAAIDVYSSGLGEARW